MYARLTPQWAGTLLGLLEVCLIPIPFVFYRYGERIRSKSRLIRQMREDQAKNESRRARQLRRLGRAVGAEEEGATAAGVEREGVVVGDEKAVGEKIVSGYTTVDNGRST